MSERCKDSVRENTPIEPGNEKWQRVRARLEFLYGPEAAPGITAVLQGMIERAASGSMDFSHRVGPR